ncbi:MAG: hypothetical protein ACLGIK_15560 [Gemmatimonadota bacterium]
MRTLRPIGVSLAATAALAAVFAAPARSQLSIGPVVARPGEKVSGYIDVPAGVDSATRIPVSVIQGRTPGPVLALVAGTHGMEVARSSPCSASARG